MAYNNMGRMSSFLSNQMQAAPGGMQRNMSQFTGNPMGANNMPANRQRPDLGRYRPPTFDWAGSGGGMNWADQGGYSYNIPDSYGTPGNYYDSGFSTIFSGQGYGAPMRPSIMNSYLGGDAGMQGGAFRDSLAAGLGGQFDARGMEALMGQSAGGQSLPGYMNNKGPAPAPANDVASRPPMIPGRRLGYNAVSAFGTGRNRPMLGGRGGLFQNGFAGTPAAYGDTPMPLPVAPGELMY